MIGGRSFKKATAEIAYDILESLKLESAATSSIAQLSYGRQRLVEIAIALALRPSVLAAGRACRRWCLRPIPMRSLN